MSETTTTTTDDRETRYQVLVERLKADRLNRRLSWDKYAKLLDVPISTLAKMARGATKRPHETTIAWLEQQLDQLRAKDVATAKVINETV